MGLVEQKDCQERKEQKSNSIQTIFERINPSEMILWKHESVYVYLTPCPMSSYFYAKLLSKLKPANPLGGVNVPRIIWTLAPRVA
jgi:hypothetical protein